MDTNHQHQKHVGPYIRGVPSSHPDLRRRNVSILAIAIVSLFVMSPAKATWVQATGTITGITNYSHTDTVLIALSVAGAAGTCADSSIFALDGSMSTDRRKQIFASLLSAQARGVTVTITYDDSGGCVTWDGTPNVFRGIARFSAP